MRSGAGSGQFYTEAMRTPLLLPSLMVMCACQSPTVPFPAEHLRLREAQVLWGPGRAPQGGDAPYRAPLTVLLELRQPLPPGLTFHLLLLPKAWAEAWVREGGMAGTLAEVETGTEGTLRLRALLPPGAGIPDPQVGLEVRQGSRVLHRLWGPVTEQFLPVGPGRPGGGE